MTDRFLVVLALALTLLAISEAAVIRAQHSLIRTLSGDKSDVEFQIPKPTKDDPYADDYYIQVTPSDDVYTCDDAGATCYIRM